MSLPYLIYISIVLGFNCFDYNLEHSTENIQKMNKLENY